MLTASGTEENLLGAIRGGAAGYLLKSEPPERIVEFLRGVARGEAALSGSIARRLLDTVRESGGRETGVPDSIAAEFTAREVEVSSCSTTASRRPRSRSGCSSPSTRCART